MAKNTTQKTHTLDDLFNGKGKKTIIANNQLIKELIEYLVNLETPRLISFNYETEYEQSTYCMTVGGSTEEFYKREIETCKSIRGKGKYNTPVFTMAIDTHIESREESLTVGIGNHSKYTQKGKQTCIQGKNSSVQVNNDTGAVTITGILVRKTVNVKKKDKVYKPSKDPVIEARNIIKSKELQKIFKIKLDTTTIHSISYNKRRISVVSDARIIEVKKLQKKLKRPLTEAERDDLYSRIS